jgi:lipopolysaccharide export system permease protein
VWNETVVPFSSRRFQYVNNVEIRKRAVRGILSGREIWYHGQLGFYNIEHIDTERESIRGLTVYRVDDQFHLDTVVEIPELIWQQGKWAAVPAVEYRLSGGPPQAIPLEPGKMSLPESFEDLLEFRREPEELSYLTLRNWINELLRKGIDASHLLVDLHMKLAVPFASFALALVGIPISARVRRHPSLAATFGLGMVVGFGYWVVLALGNSLGQSGVLSPVVAAWAANTFFALIGCALFLAGD